MKNKIEKQIIGRVDKIDLPEFGIYNLPVKIDTGASRSSLHCTEVKLTEEKGIEFIHFHVPFAEQLEDRDYSTSHFTTKKIRSSNGKMKERYVVETKAIIFGEEFDISFSLNDRSKMKYPALLGRRLLRQSFIVDVTKKNLSYKHKKDK